MKADLSTFQTPDGLSGKQKGILKGFGSRLAITSLVGIVFLSAERFGTKSSIWVTGPQERF
ncbi:MAG: hypothetical protein ACLQGU_22005 [bacterium]